MDHPPATNAMTVPIRIGSVHPTKVGAVSNRTGPKSTHLTTKEKIE